MHKFLLSLGLATALATSAIVVAPMTAHAQTAASQADQTTARTELLRQLRLAKGAAATGVDDDTLLSTSTPAEIADAALEAMATQPALVDAIVQVAVGAQVQAAPLIVGTIAGSPKKPEAISAARVAANGAIVAPQQSPQIVAAAATASGEAISTIVTTVAQATNTNATELQQQAEAAQNDQQDNTDVNNDAGSEGDEDDAGNPQSA